MYFWCAANLARYSPGMHCGPSALLSERGRHHSPRGGDSGAAMTGCRCVVARLYAMLILVKGVESRLGADV